MSLVIFRKSKDENGNSMVTGYADSRSTVSHNCEITSENEQKIFKSNDIMFSSVGIMSEFLNDKLNDFTMDLSIHSINILAENILSAAMDVATTISSTILITDGKDVYKIQLTNEDDKNFYYVSKENDEYSYAGLPRTSARNIITYINTYLASQFREHSTLMQSVFSIISKNNYSINDNMQIESIKYNKKD